MELVAIVGSCGTRLCHAQPTVARPHLVNATLPAPKWPPAVGQCGQVGVVELFIIFCDTPALPLDFFAFVLYFHFFFLLCFAAALFLARVPFCAYAILVYLLAILLAMNLFVFIVKPTAELPQNTNKQRPTFGAAAPPRLPYLPRPIWLSKGADWPAGLSCLLAVLQPNECDLYFQ